MKLLLIIAFASDAYNLFHLVNAAESSSSLIHTPDSTNSENAHGIFQDRPEQGLRPLNPRLNPNPEDGFRTPNNRPNLAGVDSDVLFLPSFGSHSETSSMGSSSPEILRGNSWLYPNGQENQILRNLRFESPVGDGSGGLGHGNPNILLSGILDGDGQIRLRPRPQNLGFPGNQNHPRDNRPVYANPEQRHRGLRLNFRYPRQNPRLSENLNQPPQRINQPIHVNPEQGLRTPIGRGNDINAEQGFRTPVDQRVNNGQAALQGSRPNANPEQRHRGLRLNFRPRPQNQRLSENLNQPSQRTNQPIHVNQEQGLHIERGNDINAEQGLRTPVNQRVNAINAEQGFRTPPFNDQLSPFEVPVLARRPDQPIQLPNIESQRAQGESVLQPGRRERNPFRGIFGNLGRPSAGRVNQHGNINPEAGNNLAAPRNPSTPRTPLTPILRFRF